MATLTTYICDKISKDRLRTCKDDIDVGGNEEIDANNDTGLLRKRSIVL